MISINGIFILILPSSDLDYIAQLSYKENMHMFMDTRELAYTSVHPLKHARAYTHAFKLLLFLFLSSDKS